MQQTIQLTKQITTTNIEAKPFVKWAGGKKQLLNVLVANIPKQFNNYFEPFVGGGALFFKLFNLGKIKQVYLNDVNAELINAYRTIKEKPLELIHELKSGKYQNNQETFYQIRTEEPTDPIKATARFIYLNKTAFNGLYRVNAHGKFNVPFGKYKNPKIPDEENLLAVSKALQRDEITCMDFEDAVSKANKNDFIYFDPPYQPIKKTSFTKYTAQDFTRKDQERLFKCFERLNKKGCLIMISNSYSDFIKELYKNYNIKMVLASRAINCKAEGRGKIKEVLITNY